jgi:hypothetical protein
MSRKVVKTHVMSVLVTCAFGAANIMTTGTTHAGALPDVPACSAEVAGITAAEEAANAGGDAIDDAAGALGIPVETEGVDLALNQVNANLADISASLVTIAASTCATNNTLSYPPGPTAATSWTTGKDPEPDTAVIPAQVDGEAGLASDMATDADKENDVELTTTEALTTTDPEAGLLSDQIKGEENMQGVALTNMELNKLTIKDEMAMLDRLKTSENVKDLLANEGVVQLAAVDTLIRTDEDVEQTAVNEAQEQLNKSNEEKVLWDDRKKTAVALIAAAGAAGLAVAGQ